MKLNQFTLLVQGYPAPSPMQAQYMQQQNYGYGPYATAYANPQQGAGNF